MSAQLRFTNVTASSRFQSLREQGGHGVQIADVTGNGFPDVYVTHIFDPSENRPDLLFLNQENGSFREEGQRAGVADDGFFGGFSEESHAALFVDLDNDGDYDLFNAHTFSGNHRLYRNDGGGRFTDVSDSDGIAVDGLQSRGVAAGDVNGDGLIDLILSAWANAPARLYLNRGSMQFERRNPFDRKSAILANQGIMLADFDGDGDPDLALTGHEFFDAPVGPISLLRNEGGGRFVDVTDASGFRAETGTNGWSFGDLDNDADLDALIVAKHQTKVYLNRGGGQFALTQRLGRGNYTAALGDFDHDGDLDVYIGGKESIYTNDGRGRFELRQDIGISGVGNDGRAAALGDLDRDGDLDIVIASKRGDNTLFRNETNDDNWLQVRLVGTNGNAGALGAKVFVYDSRHLDDPNHLIGFREARASTGYCTQDSPVLHFGVRAAQDFDVKVVFPNGRFHVAKGVTAPAFVDIDPNAPLR